MALGSHREEHPGHYKNGVQMMIWTTFSVTVLQIIGFGGIAGDWLIFPATWFGLALLLSSTTFFTLQMFRL